MAIARLRRCGEIATLRSVLLVLPAVALRGAAVCRG
jgi:hypothetical protein